MLWLYHPCGAQYTHPNFEVTRLAGGVMLTMVILNEMHQILNMPQNGCTILHCL